MRQWLTILGLMALCGCSGDDQTPAEVIDTEFRVVVEAVDGLGAPVTGLQVGVVNDILVDTDKAAARVTLAIPFVVPEESIIRLFVQDIEGDRCRTLVDDLLGVFFYLVEWDGRDDEGEPLPAGRYTVIMRAFPPGGSESIFTDRTDVFMQREPSEVSVGVTGEDGTFTITDTRLFPGLFGFADMVATNEDGVAIGTVGELPTVTFAVWRTAQDAVVDAFAIELGPNTVQLIYDPAAATVPEAGTPAGSSLRIVTTAAADEAEFELREPYPNPFN